MSDTDPNITTTTEAPAEAPHSSQDAQQEAWYDEVRRQYPNAQDDRALLRESWQSYRHAQNALQSRQPEPEPEAEYEEPPDPYAQLPVDVDPQLYQRFHAGLQQDPQNTIRVVLDNRDAFPLQIQREAFLAGLQLDPFNTLQNAVGSQFVARDDFQAWQEQQQQAYQPWIANTAEGLGDAAENLARQASPYWDDYRDKVIGYLSERPHELDGLVRAKDIADRLVQYADMFWAADQRTRQAQNGSTTPTPAQPQQRRATETRSTTPRPQNQDAQARLLETMRTGKGL